MNALQMYDAARRYADQSGMFTPRSTGGWGDYLNIAAADGQKAAFIRDMMDRDQSMMGRQDRPNFFGGNPGGDNESRNAFSSVAPYVAPQTFDQPMPERMAPPEDPVRSRVRNYLMTMLDNRRGY